MMGDMTDDEKIAEPNVSAVRTKVQMAAAVAKDTTVTEGWDLMVKLYHAVRDHLDGEPATLENSYPWFPKPDPRLSAGLGYMSLRCQVLADLFRDGDECGLRGRAGATDLLRGLRVVSMRHPQANAREMSGALANTLSCALRAKAGGDIPIDMDAELRSVEGVRRTLVIWSEQAMRAHFVLQGMMASGGRITVRGLTLAKAQAQMRIQVTGHAFSQGLAELGLLIHCVGLPMDAPDPLLAPPRPPAEPEPPKLVIAK